MRIIISWVVISCRRKIKKHPDHALQAIGVFRIIPMDSGGAQEGYNQYSLCVLYACPTINNMFKQQFRNTELVLSLLQALRYPCICQRIVCSHPGYSRYHCHSPEVRQPCDPSQHRLGNKQASV